jgi:hypothetical protein
MKKSNGKKKRKETERERTGENSANRVEECNDDRHHDAQANGNAYWVSNQTTRREQDIPFSNTTRIGESGMA